jgi:TRAP-type C4-dicarboxylate transport system substrate-binding protein
MTDDRPPMTDRSSATGDRRQVQRLLVLSHRSSVVGRRLAAAAFALLLLGSSQTVPGREPVTIKFATLAPEGSTWMRLLREMDAEVHKRSNGRVRFLFYPGGVLGDEIDVLRKIRVGQLHAGAFSGVGLGSVVPSIRVLELPLLFRNTGEIEFVTGRLEAQFARAFEERGFVLLALAEAGAVHIFSKKPIRRREDLDGVKIWAWQGDPLAAALFERYQVAPVPLALPEVLPSLQTGLINAFYAPPAAAIALQWFTQVSHMSAPELTYAIGGMLVSRSRWETIPADLHAVLRETARKHARQVVLKTRQENQEALQVLKRSSIQTVNLDQAELSRLTELSRQLWEREAGKLYPRALLDEVLSLLQQHRGRRP